MTSRGPLPSSSKLSSLVLSLFIFCLVLPSPSGALRSQYAARLLRDHVAERHRTIYGRDLPDSGLSPLVPGDDHQSRRLSRIHHARSLPSDDDDNDDVSSNSSDGLLSTFNLTSSNGILPSTTPSHGNSTSPANASSSPEKICIIGAGIAGLYLAWMLTFLHIPYDLYESSDRVGGRAFTYRFPASSSSSSSESSSSEDRAAHDYYDVGAMRYPKIEALKPVFAVFEKLGIRTEKYYLENPSAPWGFDKRIGGGGVIASGGTGGRDAGTMADTLRPFEQAVTPFINLLTQDFDVGFKKLIEIADQYSTREYLHNQAGLDFDEIQRLETFDTGTGLFDQAFSESVLDWYDFATAKEWFRIENGTGTLIDAISEQIATPPILNTKVDAIRMSNNGSSVEVISTEANSNTQTKRGYGAVFSTTSLGCLQRIDLGGLPVEDPPYKQWTAIRSLHYDSASKVAIKFRSAWWITKGGVTPLGGASYTDTPIRIVVYPPWMDEDDVTKPAVLVASYTWAQDATRMSSLISEDSPQGEEELMDLVLRNLVLLFNDRNITLSFLQSQVISHHAFSWSQDPNTAGAFALFGPGQFSSLYPDLVRPLAGSSGRIHIVGEHASAHHAWMSGPMYSAATSLYVWLSSGDRHQRTLAAKLKESWFGASIDGEEAILEWAGYLSRNEGGDSKATER